MNIDSKRKSNTPDQIQFQNSLRKTQRTCLVQNSSVRRNSNENEFLGSQLRKLVMSLSQGNAVKCHQNIDLLFTDKNHPIHKHISFQLYIPEERSTIGLKILENQDIWILLLIYFDLIREGENAYNIKQQNQIIQQMTKYLDRDSIAIVNQKVEQFHKSSENKSIKKWANQLSQSLKISQDFTQTPEFEEQQQIKQKQENEFTFDQQKLAQIRKIEQIVKFSPSILDHQPRNYQNEIYSLDEIHIPQSDIAEFNQSADAISSQPIDSNIQNDDKIKVDSFYQFQDSFYLENNDQINQEIQQQNLQQEQRNQKQQVELDSSQSQEQAQVQQQLQNQNKQEQEQEQEKELNQEEQHKKDVKPQEQESQIFQERENDDSNIQYLQKEEVNQDKPNQYNAIEPLIEKDSENMKNQPNLTDISKFEKQIYIEEINQEPLYQASITLSRQQKPDTFSEEIIDQEKYLLEQNTEQQHQQLAEQQLENLLEEEQRNNVNSKEVSIQLQQDKITNYENFYEDDNVFYPENQYNSKEEDYHSVYTNESALQTKQIKQEKISKKNGKSNRISENDIHQTIQTIIDEETSQINNKRFSSNRKKRESLNLLKNENSNDLVTHGSGYRYQLIQAPQSIQQQYGVKELICKKRSSKRFSYQSDISSPKLSNCVIFQANNTEGFEANNEIYQDLAQKSHDLLKCEGNPWRQKRQNKIIRFKNNNDCELIEEIVLIDFIDENINDNHTHNLAKIISGQFKDFICLVEIQHIYDPEVYFQDYQYYCCQLLYHYNKQDPIYVPMKCYKLRD